MQPLQVARGRSVPSMKKEERLINKIKRLLKRLGCPRWLHHFGPKKYEFLEHLQAIFVMRYCRLSYRRIVKLFDLLGVRCPSKSALHYNVKKISSAFWQKILKITAGISHYLIAIDSTGFSRTNPSYYYLRRIDGKLPKIPVKMSAAFDTKRRKFCAAKIRVLPAHDINDAEFLVAKSKPKILVADKGYDANWLHEYCAGKEIQTHIPIRKCNGKPRHKNFSARMNSAKAFRVRTYHRRELIEAGNSSIKRKFGASVSSISARMIRAEIYGRLICHNLFLFFFGLLGQSLC